MDTSELVSAGMTAMYNLAIDHAISIVEGNKATLDSGTKATRDPEILCDQIKQSLLNLKK